MMNYSNINLSGSITLLECTVDGVKLDDEPRRNTIA